MVVFEVFMDPECKAIKEFMSLPNDDSDTAKLAFLIHQQFALRIIFYEPTLFMKSLEKVSLKDLILSDDFTLEDAVRFFDLWKEMMGFALKWCKDAVIDALAIVHHGTAANVGSVRKFTCRPFLWKFLTQVIRESLQDTRRVDFQSRPF